MTNKIEEHNTEEHLDYVKEELKKSLELKVKQVNEQALNIARLTRRTLTEILENEIEHKRKRFGNNIKELEQEKEEGLILIDKLVEEDYNHFKNKLINQLTKTD